MIGIDTSFLVAWAIAEHPDHAVCRQLAADASLQGHALGLTFGVLAEFVHVVTDPRRFTTPLDMTTALALSDYWSQAAEVTLIPQDAAITQQWITWMKQHQLGRKRVLDTVLAATWHQSGIQDVYTLNPADFTIFKQFIFYPTPRP